MINLTNGSWLCMHGQFTSTCTCLLLCSYSTQIHLPNLLSILQLKISSRDHAGTHNQFLWWQIIRFDFVKLSCDSYSYHMGRIPVVCRPHWHLCCPRSHHRWFPKRHFYILPPSHTCFHQTEILKTCPDKELWKGNGKTCNTKGASASPSPPPPPHTHTHTHANILLL